MRRRRLLALAAALGLARTLRAQPVTAGVLESLEVRRREGAVVLDIVFRFPVAYLRHVPRDRGDTLLVQVRPLVPDPAEEVLLAGREALPIPPDVGVPLIEVAYEGDQTCSRHLVLRFARAVAFTVRPGDGGRSIRIELPADDP